MVGFLFRREKYSNPAFLQGKKSKTGEKSEHSANSPEEGQAAFKQLAGTVHVFYFYKPGVNTHCSGFVAHLAIPTILLGEGRKIVVAEAEVAPAISNLESDDAPYAFVGKN